MEPYYYGKMNKVQQAAYHAMLQGLKNLEDEGVLKKHGREILLLQSHV